MRRDTGLGNCPACNSTTLVTIPRTSLFRPERDLVCSDCGERWPLGAAETDDPWAAPRQVRAAVAAGDPVDEDALDRLWARWSATQDSPE